MLSLTAPNKITQAFSIFNQNDYQKHLPLYIKEVYDYIDSDWYNRTKQDMSLVDMRKSLHRDLVGYAQEPIQLQDSNYEAKYKWCPSDNETTWSLNCQDPIKVSLLKKLGYCSEDLKPINVDYKLNKFGFRCKNFTNDPGIVFLGCSFTYGIGVEQHLTFPEIISNHFGLQCWNLGMPGKGPDLPLMYASLFMAKEIPNIKAIVMFWPPAGRHSIFTNTHNDYKKENTRLIIENFHNRRDFFNVEWGTSRLESYFKEPGEVFVDDHPKTAIDFLTILKENNFLRYNQYAYMLQALGKRFNVPVVSSNTDVVYTDKLRDLGRDLSHFGRISHNTVANIFIEKLSKSLDK